MRANAVVVFVNYTRSPEVHHPVALEECYDALEWITKNGASIDVDPNSIVVAGDSVGGTLATVLASKLIQNVNPKRTSAYLFHLKFLTRSVASML